MLFAISGLLMMMILGACSVSKNVETEASLPKGCGSAEMKNGYFEILASQRNLPDYDSTEVYEKGNYLCNRKNGEWTRYYPGGRVKSKIHYIKGRANGPFQTYYDNGNLEESGCMKGRILTGLNKYYYETGCLAFQKKFNLHGQSSDTTTYFFPDCASAKRPGKIELQFVTRLKGTNFNHERETTVIIDNSLPFKFKDSTLYLEHLKVEYYNGNLHYNNVGNIITDGMHKVYLGNGDILLDGEFKDGNLKNGQFFVYDEDGLLEFIKVYKEAKFVAYKPIRD